MAHDPGHEFMNVRDQLWGPMGVDDPYPDQNVGFVYSYAKSVGISFQDAKRVMTAFTSDRLPVLNALARGFAVCDMWFSSLPGPTWPNRFFVHAATSGGLISSPDPTNLRGDLTKNYDWATIKGFDFPGGTIYEQLESPMRRWRIYHGDRLPQVAALQWMLPKLVIGDGFSDFSDFAQDVASGDLPAYTFIEPNYGNMRDFTRGNSQHPVGDVRDGERLIKTVYQALRSSPLWKTTALVIMSDEHGGFYDHIVPADAAPTGYDNQFNGDPVQFDFDKYGIRVPVVIVSPYTPAGLIDHTTYDHTSLLKTVENRFDLDHLTKRDKVANDFGHLFSLSQPREDMVTVSDPSTDPPATLLLTKAVAPALPDKAIPSAGSFAHLAMMAEMHMNPEQTPTIKARIKSIGSEAEAAKYITEVQEKVEARRNQ
jgi:phospholipase C